MRRGSRLDSDLLAGSQVVKNVAVQSLEVKKLVYIWLVSCHQLIICLYNGGITSGQPFFACLLVDCPILLNLELKLILVNVIYTARMFYLSIF
jgi:hypothetical protein